MKERGFPANRMTRTIAITRAELDIIQIALGHFEHALETQRPHTHSKKEQRALETLTKRTEIAQELIEAAIEVWEQDAFRKAAATGRTR